MRTLVASLLLGFLLGGSAAATPSFDLVISLGGVAELAVGEKLQCYAYQPAVHRPAAREARPLPIALAWRVVPKDAALIDAHGRLEAKKPGPITVHVEDARTLPEGELPAGLPGQRSLVLRGAKALPGGRLPRVTGVVGLDALELEWRRGATPAKPRLFVRLVTLDWIVWFETRPAAGQPLPWTCAADAQERALLRNTYHGPIHPTQRAGWREDLTDASVTLHAWKDGVARGLLQARSRRGPSFRAEFHARLADPHGLLAAAAKPPQAKAR